MTLINPLYVNINLCLMKNIPKNTHAKISEKDALFYIFVNLLVV